MGKFVSEIVHRDIFSTSGSDGVAAALLRDAYVRASSYATSSAVLSLHAMSRRRRFHAECFIFRRDSQSRLWGCWPHLPSLITRRGGREVRGRRQRRFIRSSRREVSGVRWVFFFSAMNTTNMFAQTRNYSQKYLFLTPSSLSCAWIDYVLADFPQFCNFLKSRSAWNCSVDFFLIQWHASWIK